MLYVTQCRFNAMRDFLNAQTTLDAVERSQNWGDRTHMTQCSPAMTPLRIRKRHLGFRTAVCVAAMLTPPLLPCTRLRRHSRIPKLKRSLPRVPGEWRSEVKEERRAEPGAGDMSGVTHPATVARADRRRTRIQSPR